MRIQKWVEFGSEIDIDLTKEDLNLMWKEISGHDVQAALKVLYINMNSLATYTRSVPDEVIAKMPKDMKKIIHGLLIEQANRYALKQGNNAEKKERNKILTMDILTGMPIKDAAEKHGIAHDRARKIYLRTCQKANPELYDDLDKKLLTMRMNKYGFFNGMNKV